MLSPAGLFTTQAAEAFTFSSLFSYPKAPTLELTDLYGSKLSIDSYKGKVVIVSFIDKKSQDEAIKWVESLPSTYLGDSRIAFANVIYPGGVSFLVPRKKVLSRLKNNIETLRTNFAQSLSKQEQNKLSTTEIRWAADWKRNWSSKWGTIRHMVNIFVVDQDGMLRDTIRGMNDKVIQRLKLVIDKLIKSGK